MHNSQPWRFHLRDGAIEIHVDPARDQLCRALSRSGYPQIAIRFGYGTPGRPTHRHAVAETLPTG